MADMGSKPDTSIAPPCGRCGTQTMLTRRSPADFMGLEEREFGCDACGRIETVLSLVGF